MNTLQRLLGLTFSVFLFTACGQTSAEKAKESADSAIVELKAAANTLDSMGTPRSSWSEEEFDRYEAALNSCESNTNRIESLNGKDGVIVYGTWSLPHLRELLASNRSALAEAREGKTKVALSVEELKSIQSLRDLH